MRFWLCCTAMMIATSGSATVLVAAEPNPPASNPARTLNERLPVEWTSPQALRYEVESADGTVRTMRLDLETGKRREVARRGGSEDAVLRGGPIPRSRRSSSETSVTFLNQAEVPVELVWVDPRGRRRAYGHVQPGQSRSQHTYAGHAWLVQADDGTYFGSILAPARESTVEIKTTFQRPKSSSAASAPTERPKKTRAARPSDWQPAYRVREGRLQIRESESPRQSGDATQRAAAENIDGEAAWQTLKVETTGETLVRPSWSPDGRFFAVWSVTRHPAKEVMLLESSPQAGGRAQVRSHPYRLPGDAYDEYELLVFDAEVRCRVPLRMPVLDFGRPRVRWFGRHRMAVEKIDRGHQRVRLFVIDPAAPSVRVAIDERSRSFIWTTHGPPVPLLTYLPDSSEVIYASEASGYRHLYRVDLEDTEFQLKLEGPPPGKQADSEWSPAARRAAITSGDWLVREIVHVDAASRTVDVLAGGFYPDQDPYHRHLLRCSLDGDPVIPVTDGDGDHTVQRSPDGQYAVVSFSRADAPPVHQVRRMADGELIAELARAERIAAEENEWSLPVVFQAKGRDGVTDIWGNLYFPASFDPSRRRHYPLIEAIYAGPHDAHVPKRYQHGRRFQELTSLGFVVVQIDGMGTANRSKAFHDRCWQDLKDAGFPDRIAWMRAAAEAYPALDLSRVGVFGTSAGGQNACAALLWHGDLYRAAYAACGCHDNRMDKASWNEQWMGYPVGPHYAASSNIEHARRLRGQLFLVVGELDRNVPPESTYRLVDALIDADKDFEFLMVPGMGHSDGGVYGRRRMREFFVDAFAPPASPIKPASSPKDR